MPVLGFEPECTSFDKSLECRTHLYLDSLIAKRVEDFAAIPYARFETIKTPYIHYSYRRRKNVSHALGSAFFLLLALDHDC